MAAGVANWMGDLDNHIDALENNGTDNFGDTLLGLQVSLPADVVSVWKDAPGEPASATKRKVPEYLEPCRGASRRRCGGSSPRVTSRT